MKLTSAVQESIVSMYCFDGQPRGAKFIRTLVPPRLLDPYFRDIASEADAYLKKYGVPPGDHTLDIIDQLKATHKEKAEVYDRLYHSLVETSRSINRDYILDRAASFAQHQRLKTMMSKALEALEKDTEEGVTEAHAALVTGMKERTESFDHGVFLSDESAVIAAIQDDEGDDVFPCGVRALDDRELGPARGRLHLLCAAAKKGKTWWLLWLAKNAIMAGKRVLYISLENGQRLTLRRCVQSFFSVSKREASNLTRMSFKQDDMGRFLSFEPRKIPQRPSMRDSDIVPKVRKMVAKLKRRPKLLIKQFPTRSITVRDIDGFLDSLEGIGFIPDLLLVDYPDLLRHDPKFFRQELRASFEDLRGLGVKRNIGVAAVTQLNRSGADKSDPGVTDVGEDWSKIATADTVLIYAQTDSEKELGIARLKVAAGREDADGFSVLISQNYTVGQFCMDSTVMSAGYWDQVSGSSESHEDLE